MPHRYLSVAITGSGPPVLLLHGLGGDRHQSLGLLPDGARATRVAPELPGHGRTDLLDGEPVGFAPFVAATAALIDDLHAAGQVDRGPMPVVGVSMGAGLAVGLAASRPDLVRTLTLIRPAWLDVAPPPNLAPFLLVAELLCEHGPQAGQALFRDSETYRDLAAQAPAMATSLLGQFTRQAARMRARVLAEMPLNLPLPDRDAYARLAVPTLVLAAPGDPVHPDGLARTLSQWIPGARFGDLPRKMPDATEHQWALHVAVWREIGDLP